MLNIDLINNLVNLVFENKFPACLRDHMDGLVKLSSVSPKGCFVECGVARGGTGIVLAEIARQKNEKLFLCDSYSGFPNPEEIDLMCNIPGGHGATYLTKELVVSNFGKANVSTENVSFVKGFFNFTMPILSNEIEPISFIHFDGDFYQSTVDVLDNLWKKVVKGGVVVFHDYPVYDGVKKAVEERFKLEEINFLTSGSSYVIKQ
jgi:hypothetical protein